MNKEEVIKKTIEACNYGFWAGICGFINLFLSPFLAFLGFYSFFTLIYVVFLTISLYSLGKLFGDSKIKIAGISLFLSTFLMMIAVTYAEWVLMKTHTEQIFMGEKLFSNQTAQTYMIIPNWKLLNTPSLIFLSIALLTFMVSQILLIYSLFRFSEKLRVKIFQYTAVLLGIFLIFVLLNSTIGGALLNMITNISQLFYYLLLAASFRIAKNSLRNVLVNLTE